jgi:hypothetical protein
MLHWDIAWPLLQKRIGTVALSAILFYTCCYFPLRSPFLTPGDSSGGLDLHCLGSCATAGPNPSDKEGQ